MKELFGPAANYDARARPQYHAVNVSISHVLENILELVYRCYLIWSGQSTDK